MLLHNFIKMRRIMTHQYFYSIIGNTLKFVSMGVAAYLWTDTESEFGTLVFDGLNIGYPATSMTSGNYLNIRCLKD